jgi:hypothetical protein
MRRSCVERPLRAANGFRGESDTRPLRSSAYSPAHRRQFPSSPSTAPRGRSRHASNLSRAHPPREIQRDQCSSVDDAGCVPASMQTTLMPSVTLVTSGRTRGYEHSIARMRMNDEAAFCPVSSMVVPCSICSSAVMPSHPEAPLFPVSADGSLGARLARCARAAPTFCDSCSKGLDERRGEARRWRRTAMEPAAVSLLVLQNGKLHHAEPACRRKRCEIAVPAQPMSRAMAFHKLRS